MLSIVFKLTTAVLALSCFRPALLSAGTIVSVAGSHGSVYSLGATNQMLAASWSSTQGYSNVDIAFEGFGFPVTAYLMNHIGPGASTADQVAVNTVNVSGPMTNLFTGLSLPAGTYFLVLTASDGGWETSYCIPSCGPSQIAVGNGVTLGGQYVVNNGNGVPNLAYPPASIFHDYFNEAFPGFELKFQVTGDSASPVPEPATWLSGVALLGGLLLAHRNRAPLAKNLVPFAVMFGFLAPVHAQPVEIRMGTLAPQGSPWHKVLERMGQRWREISGGKVTLKIFAGTLGDEPDLVNKMRINQIQAVALTGAGMSDIEKGVGALQIPMLIQSYEELDCVRDGMAPRLEKLIESRGYILLNWGDAGWVHFFSRKPMRSVDDLRQMKLFTWAGDADELELWKANGFNPIPLAATDILLSLQTGLINAVPSVPLMALWNQYFGLAPYMNDIKWAPLVGATVVSKAAWEKIPREFREPMLAAARESGAELRKGIRSMGDESIKAMTGGQPGKRSVKLTVVHADAAAIAEWRRQAEAVYPKMRGKLIPADLFDEARGLCEQCRARLNSGSK